MDFDEIKRAVGFTILAGSLGGIAGALVFKFLILPLL